MAARNPKGKAKKSGNTSGKILSMAVPRKAKSGTPAQPTQPGTVIPFRGFAGPAWNAHAPRMHGQERRGYARIAAAIKHSRGK